MNRVERGASQQQRVLTFNDFFANAAGRAADGCLLAGMSMERSIRSGFFFLSTEHIYSSRGCCVEECVFIVSIRKKN